VKLPRFFIFIPNLGEMIQFDEHIFQMGWFNHQLAEDFLKAGAIAGEPLKKFLGEVDEPYFCRVSIE